MSYRAVKRAVETACRYDIPFRRYLGASKQANVRADSEHVSVFISELGSHAIGLTTDQSRTSFASTVP